MQEVGAATSEADSLSGAAKISTMLNGEQSVFSVSSIAPTAAGLVGTVTGALLNTVLIVMLTVFMVNGRMLISTKLHQMDIVTHQRYQQLVRAVETVPRRYLLAKLIMSALTGILIGVGLVIMGLQPDEAFIWAITAMVFNFVPFFGSLVAGVMISLYVMSVGGFQMGLIVALMVVVVNNIVSNVIEPSYFGDVLPIGKVTVLLCVIIWGYIWGIVGIFLAVPITIILKVLIEQTVGRNSLVVFMEV
jgi:AI-2 transport protein TqsA